ncbi:MAG: hypothetical protein Q4C93_00785 [Clostridia bacterium]|nr:hypothetical protein [Clostridia bacterium]
MKKLKRIAALLLALVMVFALCACSADGGKDKDSNKKEEVKKTDAELIVGTWESSVNIGDELDKVLESDMDMAEFMSYFDFGGIDITMQIVFDKDGSYSVAYVDDGSSKKIEKAFRDGFVEMFDALLEGTGYTFADVAAQENMTEDEYLDAMVEIAMQSITPLYDELSAGTYEIGDGKLYMIEDGDDKDDDTYTTYKLSKNELTLKASYTDGEKDTDSPFPMTFKLAD